MRGRKQNSDGEPVRLSPSRTRNELQTLFAKFVVLKSQTSDELKAAPLKGSKPEDIDPLEPYALRSLVTRPILRLTDELAVVPDLDCLAQSAMLGPFFHVPLPVQLRTKYSAHSANRSMNTAVRS